jgi:hypothetical protein
MPSDASPRVELFPFRFRDAVSGKWTRARYVATRDEIAARYSEWQITGPAEVRSVGGGSFNPFGRPTAAELMRSDDPPVVADVATLDAIERFLVLLFLRRYGAWCARRRRFAAMEGAAVLFRGVT